jgi:hypothetical protein
LVAGQTATVLQLPVAIEHHEHVETAHVARSADRVCLNRALAPGMASILVPNQAAVMAWQTFRSAAIKLSITSMQSLRRLKPRKQHAIPADVEKIDFQLAALTATLPSKPAAPKPEKKIGVQAAA